MNKTKKEKWKMEFAPNLGHDPNNPFPLSQPQPENELRKEIEDIVGTYAGTTVGWYPFVIDNLLSLFEKREKEWKEKLEGMKEDNKFPSGSKATLYYNSAIQDVLEMMEGK